MSYTATMTPAGLFASQFIADRPCDRTTSRAVQLLRRVARAINMAFPHFKRNR